jgi:hypothetical protein
LQRIDIKVKNIIDTDDFFDFVPNKVISYIQNYIIVIALLGQHSELLGFDVLDIHNRDRLFDVGGEELKIVCLLLGMSRDILEQIANKADYYLG